MPPNNMEGITPVSETIKYSDGSEKVVTFQDIPADQSIPEEAIPAEEETETSEEVAEEAPVEPVGESPSEEEADTSTE